MISTTSQSDVYREQLTELVHALALGQTDGARKALAAGSPEVCLQVFARGSLEKRCLKLERGLEFLNDAFDDLGELQHRFASTVHPSAYDTGRDDGLQFLEWLETVRRLTPEQQDVVACQRARMEIEAEARIIRPAHLRFQELLSLAEQLSPELGMNPDLQIHLNPILVWSRFVTRVFLDDASPLPADVVFFPVQRTVATAVLELEGRSLVQELQALSPCTLESWTCISEHAERERLVILCRDLAAMGLVAFS